MKKFKRIQRLLRRSEYETALVHYHAAKRRGDFTGAQNWLKLADMHLRVSDRFDAGVHVRLMRDLEYEEASVRAEKLAREKAASDNAEGARVAQASLDLLMDELDRRFEAEREADTEDD